MGKARPDGKGEKPERARGGTDRAKKRGGPREKPGGVDHGAHPDEELLRHMVDAASDAIVCIDGESRIVFINHAAEELWGYAREEVIGADMVQLMVPEERREHFAQSFREMISGTLEGILGKRHRFLSADRQGRPFVAEVSPSSFSAGGKDYFLAIARDVTEREELEKALRESEERYRILHDNARFGVFSFDRELVITGVNRVVTELLGFTEEELVGKGILELDILHPDDYPRVATALTEIFEGQKASRNDLRIRRKDGTYLVADVVGVPIRGPSGEVVEVINIGTDVTEQRRLEEELAQHRAHLERLVEQRTEEVEETLRRLERSERYYRALIENAYDLIAVLDDDLTIRYISPSVEKISGYTPEEALGRNAQEFFYPEDMQAVVDSFRPDLENKGITEMARYRYRHKDGTLRWQEAVAVNLLDDPAVRGIVVNARDVTESEEAKRALAESEGRYRTLVETSPDAITVTDLAGKIVMINPPGAQLLGYDGPEEVVGRNVLEFIALEDHARAIDSMRSRPPERRVRKEDYILVRRDGTRFWGEISASLLRDSHGKPIGFTAITRDITERKKTEMGLEKLNRCLLSLGHDPLANIADIIMAAGEIMEARLARYGRKERGRFQVFSSLAAEKGFLALDNVDNLVCWQLISRRVDSPVSRKDLPAGVFENDPDVITYRLREALCYPVKLKGEPVGCLCLFFDTERRFSAADIDILIMLGRAIAIEEDRWDYQEGLRDFIDIASHELRHPMALLGGFSELLRERAGELDERTLGEVADAIVSATDRLKDIAEGLVRVSLVERDRLPFSRKKEDVAHLVAQALSEMEKRFPQREFRFNVIGEIGSCPVDATRIHELMVILLDNAVKFSPSNTEIEVLVEAAREGVIVSVLDRGRGVAEESRERIFERFYQVEEAQHHSEGLGLGLFLARQIVDGHGGRIWHEDRPGGGSAFRFFLTYL